MSYKKSVVVIGILAAASMATPASAGRIEAVHNLYQNLHASGIRFNFPEEKGLVAPTLVKGLYVLYKPDGSPVGFFNEKGNLLGDNEGFASLADDGKRPKQLGKAQLLELRREIMDAIDYSLLPKATYGDGGNRRLLLLSAIDCPHCAGMEKGIKKLKGLNTTIYIVPSSLIPIKEGGMQQWSLVSKIWCAQDPDAAWQSYWATHRVSVQQKPDLACPFQPVAAANVRDNLNLILWGVGGGGRGTPRLLREDGLVLPIPADFTFKHDADIVLERWGPNGAPASSAKVTHWLDGENTAFQDSGVSEQEQSNTQSATNSEYAPVAAGGTETPRTSSGPTKINLKDVFQKMFGGK